MAKYEILDAKDAPAAPKPMTKTAQQSLEILKSLGKNQVAQIEPGDGESVRGLKSSLSRIAKSNGYKIQQWEVDGKLYLRLS